MIRIIEKKKQKKINLQNDNENSDKKKTPSWLNQFASL